MDWKNILQPSVFWIRNGLRALFLSAVLFFAVRAELVEV
jgi:hypothetical protein